MTEFKRGSKEDFKSGVKAGVPIGLGYLSVSFAFGIMATGAGLTWWQALLISMTCLTSAGQLAGVGIMVLPGHFIEMFISQLIINVRYSFMSISMAQKTEDKFVGKYRWIFGAFVTDEIYAVAVSQKEISRKFFGGLCVMPYLGWSLGTLIGALMGGILPQFVMSALSIAIYAMFIAIVVPDMEGSKAICLVVLISAVLSVLFRYMPGLNKVPSGLSISICAVMAALIGAVVSPIEEQSE